MTSIVLEAETRQTTGTGASRRLRRLENKVPAILFGGNKPTHAIQLLERKVNKALENESIYSSIFQLKIDGKSEHVLLKALHRHPWKPVILHMDFQRVSNKDILIRPVPLHFINEADSQGVKAGGKANHIMTQIEVRCKAKDLPEFIEVDLQSMEMDEVLHLSHLKLPKGVELTVDLTDGTHDLPVVSIHLPKVEVEPEEEVAATEEEASNIPSENANEASSEESESSN